MRHFIITILIFFSCVPTFGQTVSDPLKEGVNYAIDRSNIRIVVRDGLQDEPSYYLNGLKIDINKYFITEGNIKAMSFVKSEEGKQLFGDTSKGGWY